MCPRTTIYYGPGPPAAFGAALKARRKSTPSLARARAPRLSPHTPLLTKWAAGGDGRRAPFGSQGGCWEAPRFPFPSSLFQLGNLGEGDAFCAVGAGR